MSPARSRESRRRGAKGRRGGDLRTGHAERCRVLRGESRVDVEARGIEKYVMLYRRIARWARKGQWVNQNGVLAVRAR